MLFAINSFASFCLKNLPVKKWIKFFHSTGPKGVARRLVIEGVVTHSTQGESNSHEDIRVGDGAVVVIDK